MPLPVLIIGAGLGGLTLAQSLQQHGIPYRIFERDGIELQRAQGYRISIDSGGASALKAVLTPAMFEEFENSCGEQHGPGGRLDGPTGRLLGSGVLGLLGAGGYGMFWALGRRIVSKRWEKWTRQSWNGWLWSFIVTTPSTGPTPPTGAKKDYQVDRRVLRSILLEGQHDRITYESAFMSYTANPESITAHFANGTSVTGSLLVGADGVRSRVARQLVGLSAEPNDLGFRIIYGKTPLTKEVDEALHHILQHGTSFVTDTSSDGHGVLLVTEAMRFHHRRAPKDYSFWALAARKEAFGVGDDAKLLASQGKDAADIARRLTLKWDPRIRVLLDNQDEEQSATLRMTSSNPEQTPIWQPNQRVTILGDSIHCMPPTGGQGANSAMLDAAMLGAALSGPGAAQCDWSTETIQGYEHAMRYNIGDVVGLAGIGAQWIIGGGGS